MTRYQITIEYLGTNYFGWQKQENMPTIQAAIEQAIFSLSGQNVDVYGAGRTDAGVHALAQVAHFDLQKEYPAHVIKNAINHFLFHNKDHGIVILNALPVEQDFHARFSAKQRSYVYKIINRAERLAIYQNRAWQVLKTLDIDKMQQAATLLIGKRDYSCFRAISCQAKSPVITIDEAYFEVTKDNIIEFNIAARSFLHHMVRNIVGTLKLIGENKITIQEFENIIHSLDRKRAGATAPPDGLYFKQIKY